MTDTSKDYRKLEQNRRATATKLRTRIEIAECLREDADAIRDLLEEKERLEGDLCLYNKMEVEVKCLQREKTTRDITISRLQAENQRLRELADRQRHSECRNHDGQSCTLGSMVSDRAYDYCSEIGTALAMTNNLTSQHERKP